MVTRDPLRILAAAEAIDRLLTVDLGIRGVVDLLYPAAREKQGGHPLCMLAADKLAGTVQPGDVVIIATGLPIRGWYSAALAENDGPAGAATLARALYIALGSIPVLLTEEPMIPLLQAACRAAGLVVTNLAEWQSGTSSPDAVPGRHLPLAIIEGFPTDLEKAKHAADTLLETLNPSAMISIERQGANAKNVYHYGKGEANLASVMAKLDVLFERGQNAGVLTIGLGDGGNELGLGLIRDEIRAAIPFGAHCVCPCGSGIAPQFSADVVIISTTCNWGAWGIEACLALLTGWEQVLHPPSMERSVLHACTEMGALDGITGFVEPSVDGIPGEICVQVVEMLSHIVAGTLAPSIVEENPRISY